MHRASCPGCPPTPWVTVSCTQCFDACSAHSHGVGGSTVPFPSSSPGLERLVFVLDHKLILVVWGPEPSAASCLDLRSEGACISHLLLRVLPTTALPVTTPSPIDSSAHRHLTWMPTLREAEPKREGWRRGRDAGGLWRPEGLRPRGRQRNGIPQSQKPRWVVDSPQTGTRASEMGLLRLPRFAQGKSRFSENTGDST